jgi:hypothetical protein
VNGANWSVELQLRKVGQWGPPSGNGTLLANGEIGGRRGTGLAADLLLVRGGSYGAHPEQT